MRPACDHCGLPVGASGVARRAGDVPLSFCCAGCSIAFRFAGPSHRGGGGAAAALLARIGLGFVFSMATMLVQWVRYLDSSALDDPTYARYAPAVQAVLSFPVLVLLGGPILWQAIAQARRGRVGTDLLVGIALVGGYAASLATTLAGRAEPLYFDTVAGLATLITVGRWLEASAKRRATLGLRAFLSAGARPARRLAALGAPPEADEAIAADALDVGDLVRVLPGERVPLDGVVVEGRAFVDEAALTGEPVPRVVEVGATVAAPARPLDGALVLRIVSRAADSLLGRVAAVLERAREERAPLERLADRLSALFVPLVMLLAVGAAAHHVQRGDGIDAAVLHALSILVISCPCALGIATPLATNTAIGRLAERGVLVRSGEALGTLPRIARLVFDKTGTLTEGRPRVVRVVSRGAFDEAMLLELAAAVEESSEHPLARGVREAASARAPHAGTTRAFDARVVPGRGVEARVGQDGGAAASRWVRVGSPSWLGAEAPPEAGVGTCVGIEVDGLVAGFVVLEDVLRPEASPVLAALLAQGREVEIASGDSPAAVAHVVKALGLSGLRGRGGLLPDAKIGAVTAGARPVAFVGDGLNDAPALAAADLGIALGSGSDLSRETADVSLLGDDLTRIPLLLEAARATRRAVAGNLFWAFLYNLLALAWALLYELPPLFAALAMILSSLCVILASIALGARLGALLLSWAP